jgi:hypothetical protein
MATLLLLIGLSLGGFITAYRMGGSARCWSSIAGAFNLPKLELISRKI